MADEDEIDILGDFSFNSCLAQNSQGIPSCSDSEDTVHPQWLLDSTANNWYDIQNRNSKRNKKDGPPRRLLGDHTVLKRGPQLRHTMWTTAERELLVKEMAKYGRDICKISQTLNTKTEAEIQALLDAEYGICLNTPSSGLEKHEGHGDVPHVVQEEIIAEDVSNIRNILNLVSTGTTTVPLPKLPFRKKNLFKSKNSLLKPVVLDTKNDLIGINSSEILYEDDLTVGSTQSIGSDMDKIDMIARNIAKSKKEKAKALKKNGNHRRKVSRNYDNGRRSSSKELLKSPQGKCRKDSSLSDDSLKSPKMQIVFSSGQALPVSEGEQVIKIEKKKDSEPESDIDIDVDSDTEDSSSRVRDKQQKIPAAVADEAPIAVPLRKLQPMPKRNKKINLDGGGGYTIMHTESGDLYEISTEPRKERQPRKQAPVIPLIQCRVYNTEKPPPYKVILHVSTLILMDVHAHTSRAEVMGLVGGTYDSGVVLLTAYREAKAAGSGTHCDMDPVSQALAAESLRSVHLSVLGWHHSHPRFPPAPSELDLTTQSSLQQALEWSHTPFLGFITSQHWPTGRTATQYRCIRVEDSDVATVVPTGYQFSVKLFPDLSPENLREFLDELRAILLGGVEKTEFSIDLPKDVCPQAGITYLEKCISSIQHHVQSAGYSDDDPMIEQLIKGIRDVFG